MPRAAEKLRRGGAHDALEVVGGQRVAWVNGGVDAVPGVSGADPLLHCTRACPLGLTQISVMVCEIDDAEYGIMTPVLAAKKLARSVVDPTDID